MAGTGTADLDFGAFPGKSDAFVDATAAGVLTTSLVEAWIRPVATADHTADEHMMETLKVFGVCEVNGTVRIYGLNSSQLNEPSPPDLKPGFQHRSAGAVTTISWLAMPLDGAQGRAADRDSKGTRLYGVFKVAYAWF